MLVTQLKVVVARKFLIAGVNLAVCWVVFNFLFKASHGSSSIWFTPFIFSATVIYILLIPTYLVFYFSTQQMSPSKKIMILLSAKNMSHGDLEAHFKDDEWIAPRIADLITTKCIADKNGVYELTFSGLQMARLYALYQAILGRKKGG